MIKTFRVSPEVFAILGAFIEDHTGLHYGPADRELLSAKIAERASEAGFDSALDYYYYLRYDARGPEELERLVDALVVNETYFYREADALRAVVEQLLRPIVAAGGRPRVWSAACATGEEPLSLAMMLADQDLLAHTRILATDISQRALARAREGEYRLRSLRALPADLRDRWFCVDGDRVRMRENLRDAIEWRRLNLLDAASVSALATFDVVLCRNVLIYFSDATVVKVAETLASRLKPGAHLVIGASESLMRFGTSLECRERGGAFFYFKAP